MGNCLSSCLPACESTRALCNFNMLSASRNDFNFLVDERSSIGSSEKRSFFTRILEKRNTTQKKPNLSMVENLLNPQLPYSRLSESQRASPRGSYISAKDIQLQCLDARALLGRTNTSTPDNSLDLEWEHETLPISNIHEPSNSSWTTTMLPAGDVHHNCGGGPTSESDWSRVSSSANSLEWDSVQNSIQSDVDAETQFLLNEIDRLTTQALRETGVVVEDNVGYLDDRL